jgi:hypothetical protein
MMDNEQSPYSPAPIPGAEYQRVERILRQNEKDLMAKANVVGVGIGYRERTLQPTQEISLIVLVSKKLPRALLAAKDIIPLEIDGVPVDVKEVGQMLTRMGVSGTF